MADARADLAIDAEGIGRRFGARWVLRGASLSVRPGEVVGLLGANGSGKTTLLKVLGTLLRPSVGTARVLGFDVGKESDEVRARVGYLAHRPGVYDDLTPLENLTFAADMLGMPHSAAAECIERVGLAPLTRERVRGLSAGMQRRVALARLLLRKASVLLLDEPYSNLDIGGIALVNTIISEAAQAGGAALVVLHELAPAAGVLDRTVQLDKGRVIATPVVAAKPGARSVAMAGRS